MTRWEMSVASSGKSGHEDAMAMTVGPTETDWNAMKNDQSQRM
jgi:hypothetical protein